MLQVNNISRTFNKGSLDEKKALCGLSLSLAKGDFVTIIGSNGAGKSTLFNAIAGNISVDEGSIVLDGNDITTLPDYKRSKRIGRMFQDPLKGTAPHMTIEENLALAFLRASGKMSAFSKISKADRELFYSKLKELDLGLEDRMSSEVGYLSGGQRQALTLLMATLVKPQLLLLDEHTAALDPATAEKVMALTKKIVEEGEITCLMITHNIRHSLDYGNRTIMMASGNIVAEISGDERRNMSLSDVMEMFSQNTGAALDNDRILLV